MTIALIKHETLPDLIYISAALLLGFVAYGLSIFLYVRAQSVIGAAKTSAYYATAPFIGAFLSFVFIHEKLTWTYFISLLVMIAGTVVVIIDTLVQSHNHEHEHTYTHFHDGHSHTHTIKHSHTHEHYATDAKHSHHHSVKDLEKAHVSHF